MDPAALEADDSDSDIDPMPRPRIGRHLDYERKAWRRWVWRLTNERTGELIVTGRALTRHRAEMARHRRYLKELNR